MTKCIAAWLLEGQIHCYSADSILFIIDAQGQVEVLYLDSSKAFDNVLHDLLILKLKTLGLTGKLLKGF